MTTARLLFVPMLALAVFSPFALSQDLVVIENEIRLEIDGNTRVSLPVRNPFPETAVASVRLSFLDPSDKTLLFVEDSPAVRPGASRLSVPVPGFSALREAERPHHGWLRLKYSIAMPRTVGTATTAAGVVSLTRIAHEPFVLKVATRREAHAGSRFQADVMVQDPLTNAGLQNIRITATLSLKNDDKDIVLKSEGRTNASGFRAVQFDMPKAGFDSAELTVHATQGSFTRVVEETLYFGDPLQIVIQTDKPIYQPGQTMRVRTLVFDRTGKALDGTPVKFTISDPEHNPLFTAQARTSRFGEAHTEWMLPENAPMGDYRIGVDPGDSDGGGQYVVAVRRYELPNFTVAAKTDRGYYGSSQDARVTVQADYLFGKPVPRARVRIVREPEREWDFRSQKWNVTEGSVITGVTDERGSLVTTLDLRADLEELVKRGSRDYEDLEFAAYVTDPTTERTEQRRFAVRITRRPIHLYVIGHPTMSPGLPLEFYVSASYADGTPAVCDIAVYQSSEDDPRHGFDATGRRAVANVKTNRFGVAKIANLKLQSASLNEWNNGASLHLLAIDGAGRGGETVQWLRTEESAIRVNTDKTLYRQFDPIRVFIESSSTSGTVMFSVWRRDEILTTRTLQLVNGRASTTVPSSSDLREDITVSAYLVDDSRLYAVAAGRTVSFPGEGSLNLHTSVPKRTYSPGDDVTVRFRSHTADREGVASVLGITVIDKAVEERARTDGEFGARSYCFGCLDFLEQGSGLPGLSYTDLLTMDRSRPVAPEVELAAEVILAARSRYRSFPWFVDFPGTWPKGGMDYVQQLDWSRKLNELALDQDYPRDEASLRALLARVDSRSEAMEDPWGNPYRLSASVEGNRHVMTLTSAGPDEQFSSPDDFQAARLMWPYFRQRGELIQRAIQRYHAETGKYVRDFDTLRMQMASIGHNIEAWRDPLGQPYTVAFGISDTRYIVTIQSGNVGEPEGSEKAAEGGVPKRSRGVGPTQRNVPVWTAGIDYTIDLWPILDRTLTRYYAAQRLFPTSNDQLAEALRFTPIPAERLTDPWGHPYYTTFKAESGYFDSVQYFASSADRRITPVTQETEVLRFRSAGPDGQEGTADDFEVARFSRIRTEQSVEDAAQRVVDSPVLAGATGAIRGTVIDSTGALIPGVTVTMTAASGYSAETLTDENGVYTFRNVAPGTYQLQVSLPGFQTKTIGGVVVRSGAITAVTTTLEVGTTNTSVEVSLFAGVESSMSLMTVSASIGEVIVAQTTRSGGPISTPRLREYFPETLLWRPALETREDGTAEVRFKLADTITTWKLFVTASTVDGEIAVAETEIVSSRPFFVDHDPPKVLTQDDEIALPVLVRNYLETTQAVDLSVKPEKWFDMLDSSSRRLQIEPGDAAKETFRFRTLMPLDNAKQRVTALGAMSDAIEKTLVVRPNGQEITQTSNRIFRGSTLVDIEIPGNSLPNLTRGELKIYPSLVTHVVDSIEAIMRRPYGCAEQVISSAYPGLLLLRYNKANGIKEDATVQKAQRFLKIAYDMLRAYQTEDGGTSYWAQGKPDAAVTAYAVQFLTEAREFIHVDEELLDSNVEWLAEQKDLQSLSLISLVARSLAQGTELGNGEKEKLVDVLTNLQNSTGISSEPYALASLALAAQRTGRKDIATWALDRLERIALEEGDTSYWDLQRNTPFYSWGLPGRLETTALVVRAFSADKRNTALVDRALLFLLRHKDRYGVWHSTQATVNVLEALLSVNASSDDGGPVEVFVDGNRVARISLTDRGKSVAPITVDLSRYLGSGAHRVEVRGRRETSDATLQVVATHYIPWSDTATTSAAPGIRLNVAYDKTSAAIGDEITCRVNVERFGFRGYGMLLAEIGLPPGADVDRKSLESALENAGWSLQRYDVLPDRVVAYLWPEAGGTSFEFKFRPRYGLTAKTPASTIYDYYNPESSALVPPTLFTIR